METTTPPAEPREAELELTPRPRIKKLSSAIVWIAAIFAVAVLWLAGYLVSAKARRPSQERRVAAVPPPVARPIGALSSKPAQTTAASSGE